MPSTEKWTRPMALLDRWEGHSPWMMALVSGILYFFTMAPTVGHTDAGELSAVAYHFGVAHPTGYPLFTLLGWTFSRIPLGSVAWRLNLMCLLFVTGSVYVWARFLREFFIQLKTTVKKGDSSYGLRIKVANLLGTVVGTLMLVWGRTWWTQATGTEVYALQCLLFGLMFWALLRAWYAREMIFLRWSIFAVALAMCFTNHLTAIALLPGVIYIFIAQFGLKWQTIKEGLGLAGIGLLVLVVFYGMLMMVALSHPAYNWGNPEDWTRLWHHMSGKQFTVYMFNGPKVFFVNLLKYFNRLPNEFGWDLIWPKIPIWICLGGIVFQGMSYTWERRQQWAIFLALCFFSNVFWAANYDIKDPEPYFLLSFMVVAFLGAMFLRWSWIGYKKFAPYFTGAYAVVLGFQVFWNFGAVNQSKVWQFDDYPRAALESLPPNAILISKTWDDFVGPACYLQGCEGLRKDVTIVDYALLHDRHWYATQLRVQDPGLVAALGARLDAWEKAVSDFDLRGKVDPRILQPTFDAVYMGIIAQYPSRPIYIGPEIFDGIVRHEITQPPADVAPVPEAYFIHLMPTAATQVYEPIPFPAKEIRFGGDPDEYETKLLKDQLAQVWEMRAAYEDRAQQGAKALQWRQMILKLGRVKEGGR